MDWIREWEKERNQDALWVWGLRTWKETGAIG